MHSSAQTAEEYVGQLPKERQQPMRIMRAFIRQHLPDGYEEMMLWGMISYVVPLDKFPGTYNKQPLGYVSLASQKNYMSIYLLGIYGKNESTFRQDYAKTGKKLDMGKSCLRFKKTDDLALEVIGKAIGRYDADALVAAYKQARG